MEFTKDHDWLLQTDRERGWRVGLTDYAQDQLGDVVMVELPEVGSAVSRGEACAVVESVKAASDIYAPVTGTVKAVNEQLQDRPELVNESPEELGWLFEIAADSEPDHSDLLDAEGYARMTSD